MTTEQKERPILFSPPMIRAILDGKKTQARRVMKPQPYLATNRKHWMWDGTKCVSMWAIEVSPSLSQCCPYGQVGEKLYVKEPFALGSDAEGEGKYYYKVDNSAVVYPIQMLQKDGTYKPTVTKWTHGMFMPRHLARIYLEITDVHVERVQQISENDAIAEGIEAPILYADEDVPSPDISSRKYSLLWDDINDKREGCSWEANPWVWALTFKRVESE